jgi:hypothetical protein
MTPKASRLLVAALGAVALGGCTVVTSPSRPYAAAPAYDPYCAEAVGEAQAAAGQAAVTGGAKDARRAQRSAGYAQRDCR